MPTVKMLQDWKSRKAGETWSPSESTARLLVASGKAVLVEEPVTVPDLPTVEPVAEPVVETEPPVVESEPTVPVTELPVLVTEPSVLETVEPVVETVDPSAESIPPGFESMPDPAEHDAPRPQPSRYAPHRSWTRQSES